MCSLAAFTKMTPEEVSEATRIRDALAAGTLVIPAGQRLTDDQIRAQNYFYQGIDVAMP